jgi:hypothetical protein
MSAPIAAVVAAADDVAAPLQRSGAAEEHELFEYLVRAHLELASAPTATLANPTALVSEFLGRQLSGFVKDAHRFEASLKGKSVAAGVTGHDEPLHPGPASEMLGQDGFGSEGSRFGGNEPVLPSTATSMLARLERFAASELNLVLFVLKQNLVSTGFTGITHTVNTLLKSQ